MDPDEHEEKLLRSVALQNAQSILLARQRAEHALVEAKEALERKAKELAHSLAMMSATLESTTDGILVTDEDGKVTGFNAKFVQMWRVPREIMEAKEHQPLLETVGRQFPDPEPFLARIAEIHASSPPETFDLLELADGRTFERFSTVQRVNERNVGRVWSFRDITERRLAELELREQSEWFRVTLASIGDAVITADTACRVTFLNPVAEKLTGWQTAEAVGQTVDAVMRIVNEANGEGAVSPLNRALAEGIVVGLANHTTLVRRDGSTVPIEDSAAPIRDPAGKIIGAVMVFHDVSERREKEMALAQSEQRFRLLGKVVPQLIWTADLAGGAEYFNERWYQYTGQTPDQALGTGWGRAVHPEDHDRTLAAWARSVSTGEAFEVESRLRTKDGGYRWFVCRAVPLREENGRIVRWYGSCADIHQQKLTEQALREEYTITEHLHEVSTALATELDLSKVVQIITDAGTRITRAQFGAFFYNPLEDGSGSQPHFTLSGVPREVFDKFQMPSASRLFGATFRGEGVIRADDIRNDHRFGGTPADREMPAGHLSVVSYLAVSVISRSGKVLGGLFFGHAEPGVFTNRDEKIIVGIAAQAAAAIDAARLYQAEQQARAAAEQANKAKDLFLAALSHELRTPLTPVLAILSSLRHDRAIPETLGEDLETVRRNVELEARLIDDLLDLTRVTRGKLELRCEHVPVGRMIEDAIKTCLPDLHAKRLSLVRDIENASETILADSARVTQILWNLFKNSIKFTPEGGTITVRSRRRRRSEDGVEQMTIEVEDTGIGIEQSQLVRMFEAFEQGDRAITRQFGGLGLGLAISKAIAESHHGSLTAASRGRGQGSTFTLELPFHGCEESENFAPDSDLTRTAPPLGSDATYRPLRILLVEDHIDTATILVRLLRRMGHDVVHADTVGAALRLAEREMRTSRIDLVMSDLGLPDGSGLDLMRELSSSYGLRGIALSGFGMESDLEQSTAAGFYRHLIKPVDMGIVRATIAEMMDGISR